YIQTHVHTHTQTETPVHTHTCTDTHTCTYTHRHVHTHIYTHKYMYIHANTYKYTHVHAYTDRAGYGTLGGGREHSTHSFLCFQFAQLLSSLTAPSANDRSGPEFQACSARRPWGNTRPHHNFHLPM
ncbi:unnamed protein product, partial [Staurois parvus]